MPAQEVDQYINEFPKEIRKYLTQIRRTIQKAAPGAEECIKYAMPSYVLHGNLIHFAAFKNHIGFYPVPSGIEAFKKELSVYKGAKGSVQFPLDQPMPLDLIRRIVLFRVKENTKIAALKKNKRICKNGHTYYKSSDCPGCPLCEKTKKPKEGFLSTFAAPVKRALEAEGITSAKKLAARTEKEILSLHGIGKASLPKFHEILTREGLAFKKK